MRQKIIDNCLSTFRIEVRDGALVLAVSENRYGDGLYTFVQAILKISDVS